MNKSAIVVLSDPANNTDEALGRVFNAMAAAYDYDHAGDDVKVMFQGAATRWPALLQEPDHAGHDLYQAIRHTVAGVSRGCADVFGAADGVPSTGLDLLTDNAVPGTTGLPSLRQLASDGYTVLTF